MVTSNLENLDCLVSLYALVSRIRLTASEPVLDAAEAFVKQIVQHYGEPNLTLEQIRAAALSAKADPLSMCSVWPAGESCGRFSAGELSACAPSPVEASNALGQNLRDIDQQTSYETEKAPSWFDWTNIGLCKMRASYSRTISSEVSSMSCPSSRISQPGVELIQGR